MSHADRLAWLVCYDISAPSRWGRVYRLLCERAIPVQFSVFATVGTVRQVLDLIEELRPLIDRNEDDLRVYKLARKCTIDLIGEPRSPEGIELLGDGTELPPEIRRLMWRPAHKRQLFDN